MFCYEINIFPCEITDLILWDSSQEQRFQFLVIFGDPNTFRCTCVSWPWLKEYLLFLFSPPFIFWQKVMNSAQQARRVLRGWVSERPVLECIGRLCLMHVDPLWQTSIASASTLAVVRTAVMDSSWTRMSSMEVSRSHSLQADVAPFHCYKTKSIQYKTRSVMLIQTGLWPVTTRL